MKIEQHHKTYTDSRKFLNARGLRQMRRDLRRFDLLIRRIVASQGKPFIPVQKRMELAHTFAIIRQEYRHKLFPYPMQEYVVTYENIDGHVVELTNGQYTAIDGEIITWDDMVPNVIQALIDNINLLE